MTIRIQKEVNNKIAVSFDYSAERVENGFSQEKLKKSI